MNLSMAGLDLLAAGLIACASPQDDRSPAAVVQQLAPTGNVRAAILVGPTANMFRATLYPATPRPRGVTADLATALGEKLGAQVELVTYSNYVEVLEAAACGAWDVTFIPLDQERTGVMYFAPAYYFFEFTYVVPEGSAIRSQGEADRPGRAPVQRSNGIPHA